MSEKAAAAAAWDGLPPDPQQDGYHVLRFPDGLLSLWRWRASDQIWTVWEHDKPGDYHSPRWMRQFHHAAYFGHVVAPVGDGIETRLSFTAEPDGSLRPHISFPAGMTADEAISVVRLMHEALGKQIAQAPRCPLHRTKVAA